MKATAILPNGSVRPLIWIPDWDFNWQGQYAFEKPIRLPQGTLIRVDSWFDNSASNPSNPSTPPRGVAWGFRTRDEMDICHFQFVTDSAASFQKTIAAHRDMVARTIREQKAMGSMLRSAATLGRKSRSISNILRKLRRRNGVNPFVSGGRKRILWFGLKIAEQVRPGQENTRREPCLSCHEKSRKKFSLATRSE